MKVVGIIAEYNPFHVGHSYHLQETRKHVGDDAIIVVVMSGNFVQRGEPAIFDKWSRAKKALQHGANLVVELPTYYATAAADDFAFGATAVLRQLGATHLSFGSEVTSRSVLSEFLETDHDVEKKACIQRALKQGLSYPTALREAGISLPPNAMLGSLYLKYLPDVTPVIIERKGRHGQSELIDVQDEEDCSYPSALAIRTHMERYRAEGTAFCSDFFSELSRVSRIDYTAFRGAEQALFWRDMSPYLLYKIRMSTMRELAACRDVTEGFQHRLQSVALRALTVEELFERVKTKRFINARIKRMMLAILLGIEKRPPFVNEKDVSRKRTKYSPSYLRVLAFDECGRMMLHQHKKRIKEMQDERSIAPFQGEPCVSGEIITKLSKSILYRTLPIEEFAMGDGANREGACSRYSYSGGKQPLDSSDVNTGEDGQHLVDQYFLSLDVRAATLYATMCGKPFDEHQRVPFIITNDRIV